MDLKKVLVVAAHPDDEVLGCGGTIARYAKEGHNCHVVILAEGVTSRDEIRDPKKRKNEICERKKHAYKAAQILGVKSIEVNSFPDNRMDSLDILDVVKVVEKVISKFKPDIIYTHHYGDLNVDHWVTARAVETATRPISGKTVSEVYSFEVSSSTEWAFTNKNDKFFPNCFVDISSTLEKKIEAMSVYSSEIKNFPHPCSRKALNFLAKTRGAQSGLFAAEAFYLVRKII